MQCLVCSAASFRPLYSFAVKRSLTDKKYLVAKKSWHRNWWAGCHVCSSEMARSPQEWWCKSAFFPWSHIRTSAENRTWHVTSVPCVGQAFSPFLPCYSTAQGPHVPRESAVFLSVMLLWSVEPLFKTVLISECFSTAWFWDTGQKSCVFSNNLHEYHHRDEGSGWIRDVRVI